MNLKLGLIRSPNVLYFLITQRWNKFPVLPGEPWMGIWSSICRQFSALSVRPWLITMSGDSWCWKEMNWSHVWQWASATQGTCSYACSWCWPFRVAARWGRRKVGSRSCQEVMINGTRDRQIWISTSLLGISWTWWPPFQWSGAMGQMNLELTPTGTATVTKHKQILFRAVLSFSWFFMRCVPLLLISGPHVSVLKWHKICREHCDSLCYTCRAFHL